MSELPIPSIDQVKHQEVQQPLIEKRHIGNCDVTFIGVEHDAPRETYPLVQISNILKGKDKAVVEYVPDEVKKLYSDPLWGEIVKRRAAITEPKTNPLTDYWLRATGINDFYTQIGNIATEQHKNVLCVDPANNIAFFNYYETLPPSSIAAGIATIGVLERRQFLTLGKEIIDNLKDPVPLKSKLSKLLDKYDKFINNLHFPDINLTRRDVIKAIGFLLLGAGEEAFSWHASSVAKVLPQLAPMFREDAITAFDMRWVISSELLGRYCQAHKEKIAVIYPQVNEEYGLLYYLDNPLIRKFKYLGYSMLPGVTNEIREYQPAVNAPWTKVPNH